MSATAPLLFGTLDATLQRAAAGDHESFGALIREHQDMVFSIAWNFLHDRGRAEEIAQEVFLQLYRTLGEIETPAHLTFWLRRVTANRCIDESRRSGWPSPCDTRRGSSPRRSERCSTCPSTPSRAISAAAWPRSGNGWESHHESRYGTESSTGPDFRPRRLRRSRPGAPGQDTSA